MASPACRFHCAECRSHFTSLRAFDLHRVDGACNFLDERIVEYPRPGVCRLEDPNVPKVGQTLYGADDGERLRNHFDAALTASTTRKTAA